MAELTPCSWPVDDFPEPATRHILSVTVPYRRYEKHFAEVRHDG